jgi:hypothetical protein
MVMYAHPCYASIGRVTVGTARANIELAATVDAREAGRAALRCTVKAREWYGAWDRGLEGRDIGAIPYPWCTAESGSLYGRVYSLAPAPEDED